MTNKLTFFVALLLLLFSNNFAQDNNKLFDFDYAQFAYDSSSDYLEVYYSINQSAMSVKQNDTSKFVEGILKIAINDSSTGKTIVSRQWAMITPVIDSGNTNLVGLLNFLLPEGVYNFNITLTDSLNKNNTKSITELIHSKPFSKDLVSLSDIQIASKMIESSNTSSIFYKNTYEITPIPTLVFGQAVPVVFYYYEVYEKYPKNKSGTLKLDCDVFNSKGKLYYSNVRIINKGYSSRVEVGTIPIFKYPTDSYALRIGLIDSADNYGKSTYKRFYVYNPEIKVVDTIGSQQSAVISSNFGILSVEECDDLFEKAKYIASEDEIDQYKKINTTEAKREFLYNFWKKRENNPEDPKAIPYKDFIQRVAESNQKFTSMKKPGWKTDRGRVLIEYGEPSEIDRNPNSTDTKPYETWHYNDIQGGVVFIFADLTGFSDYQIVNSTARGEYRDDNWQSRISVAY